jgi:hypothetical protein
MLLEFPTTPLPNEKIHRFHLVRYGLGLVLPRLPQLSNRYRRFLHGWQNVYELAAAFPNIDHTMPLRYLLQHYMAILAEDGLPGIGRIDRDDAMAMVLQMTGPLRTARQPTIAFVRAA